MRHVDVEWGRIVKSYLRGADGMTRWDGKSTESVYERCDMGAYTARITYNYIENQTTQTLGSKLGGLPLT